MKIVVRIACQSDMPGGETVILHHNRTVLIIKRRQIERIAHHLSPMLPTSKQIMIVVVIASRNLITDCWGMIMIDRTSLIFRGDILQDDIIEPSGILQSEVESQLPVFKGIDKITLGDHRIPLVTSSVTIIA